LSPELFINPFLDCSVAASLDLFPIVIACGLLPSTTPMFRTFAARVQSGL
jgi:hypothetical protein